MVRIRKITTLFIILAFLVTSFSACGSVSLNEDEKALCRLIKDYFLQGIEIEQLSRYNIDDETVYYNITWSLERIKVDYIEQPINYLFIISQRSPLVRRVFFEDMKMGLDPDIAIVWNEIKDKEPDHVFSQEEIDAMLVNIYKYLGQ